MLIHQAVIRQRIRNWAPFLVTECRFQDTRGCSEIVCQQTSGGVKVEATLLFSVKHEKGKDTPTLELGVFAAKTTPKVSSRPHPRGHRVLKSCKKWQKLTFLKMGKNKNFSATLRRLYGFCWGGGAKTDALFFAKKHVLSHFLGTSPWVGRFCSKMHTKHNGSKSCIFATWLVKG